MTRLFRTCCLILMFAFSFAIQASAQSASEPVQTDNTIEVGDTTEADADIRTRINNLLREITGFGNVAVEVSQGVVTVTGTVLDNTRQNQLTAIVNRVAGVVAIENNTEISGSLEERLTPAVERISDRGRNLLSNAPIFFVALAAFLIVAIGGWLVTTRLKFWSLIAPNSFIADVYRAVARIIFIILGIVLALDILNATALISAVLGAAGVVGLAVGFAVRDTVENFIASILLSLRQPFRPNDVVEIDGDVGTVARLTSRATILISPEGNHIRIPNATVFKGRIVNFTRDPNRRFEFTLGVDADADLADALSTAVGAMGKLDFILKEPEVGAWISEVGDSNVLLTFTGWVDQTQTSFLKARGEAIRIVKLALERAGFGLPEPIYRVRLDGKSPEADTAISPAPSRPKQIKVNDLPKAADPSGAEEASNDAAKRERDASDADDNLLNNAQKAE
ncbi:mechanosensitive ion channel [bacterium]|nr:mechanosensitive ion channel [bacterium]